MKFYQEAGLLILGTRLKRLSEMFISEISKTYKQLGITFETSWFGIFYLLQQQPKATLSYIAQQLEVSHSAVSQLGTILEKKGLVELIVDVHDKRKKHLALTADGQKLLDTIIPVWQAIEQANRLDIFQNSSESDQLLLQLNALENSLKNISLSQCIQNRFQQSPHQENLHILSALNQNKLTQCISHSDNEFEKLQDYQQTNIHTLVLFSEINQMLQNAVVIHLDHETPQLKYFLSVTDEQKQQQFFQALLEQLITQGIQQLAIAESSLNENQTELLKTFHLFHGKLNHAAIEILLPQPS